MFGVIFVPEDVKKREVRETNMGAPCQHTTALKCSHTQSLDYEKMLLLFSSRFFKSKQYHTIVAPF